jgi:hypothetical protein
MTPAMRALEDRDHEMVVALSLRAWAPVSARSNGYSGHRACTRSCILTGASPNGARWKQHSSHLT